jgi:PGF-CTERM protein
MTIMRRIIAFVIVAGLVVGTVPVGAEPATLSVSGPDTANAGETVTISYTVRNTGGNSGGYILDVSIPEGWDVEDHTDDGGTWQGDEYDWLWQTIESGESVSPSVTLSIPESTEGDTVTITAVVKSADGVEARANRTVAINSSDEDGSRGGDGGGSGDGDGDGGEDSSGDRSDSTATISSSATTTSATTPTATDGGSVTTVAETATQNPGFGPVATLTALLSVILLTLRRQ